MHVSFCLQGAEALNGADAASRGGFRDANDASELLQAVTETYQRRYFRRKREAQAAAPGSIPPRVRAHLEKKIKRLEGGTLVSVKFQDEPENKRGMVLLGHKSRPFTLGEFDELRCSCGGLEVDLEPCGCLMKAAKASGFDMATMVHKRDTADNWKEQYTGLPDFKVPSTEEIESCPADNFLVAAASYPVPRGRPSTKRLKGAIDFWKAKKRAHKQ